MGRDPVHGYRVHGRRRLHERVDNTCGFRSSGTRGAGQAFIDGSFQFGSGRQVGGIVTDHEYQRGRLPERGGEVRGELVGRDRFKHLCLACVSGRHLTYVGSSKEVRHVGGGERVVLTRCLGSQGLVQGVGEGRPVPLHRIRWEAAVGEAAQLQQHCRHRCGLVFRHVVEPHEPETVGVGELRGEGPHHGEVPSSDLLVQV